MVATIVFAPKKDGSFRSCVHYRKLHHFTRQDLYLILQIGEIIDFLEEVTVFATIGTSNGYTQVKIKEEDRDNTALTSHHTFCCFEPMLFGLKNAPETFQPTFGVILASMKWQLDLVYPDDIVIILK